MSRGESIASRVAWPVAIDLLAALRPACERIEVAGSLRRGKSLVHDIELVAVAREEDRPEGMFGSVRVDLLEERLAAFVANGYLSPRQVEAHRTGGRVEHVTRLGPAYKALVDQTGIPIDLFIVRSPASWGCIFTLRTGPGDWNTRLVTDCKAIGRRVEGGRVQRYDGNGWVVVPTPEESSFLTALGQAWVEPVHRRAEAVRIDRAIADGASA